jgi:hypothetical protein
MPDNPGDANVKAGLFHDLPSDGLRDGFTNVHAATGECPEVVVGLVHEQDRVVGIRYDCRY